MKTLLIPLDERPCNYMFPQLVANTQNQLELLVPPLSYLGHKKEPAKYEQIISFLKEQAKDCDSIVLSMDMLLYGGLIPSRLHTLQKEEVIERLHSLCQIKEEYPNIKVYAFQCIMRCPSYDSSEEEPEYYEQYGAALFRRAYLLDYQKRHGLSVEETQELNAIQIPEAIISDYETRRAFNTNMNVEVLQYVKEGVIDFLVIPQDDSSPYGYTAISQKQVIDEVKKAHLEHRVMIYPGADEVAMSLLTRSYHEYKNMEPCIYPFYASVLGPTIIPKYEDRPMMESLKAHIRVCKARLVTQEDQADILLAINAPGKFMQEAFVSEQELDISYTSYRNLLDFAYRIKEYIQAGSRVALCDSAFSNGGDKVLIQYLDELHVLDQLVAYAGWNTNCNTLGTVLSQALLGDTQTHTHLCYRIIEDVFYQSIVRSNIIDYHLPKLNLSYYDFQDKQAVVEILIQEQLQAHYDALNISKHLPVTIESIDMPWHRMFEIGMSMKVNEAVSKGNR